MDLSHHEDALITTIFLPGSTIYPASAIVKSIHDQKDGLEHPGSVFTSEDKQKYRVPIRWAASGDVARWGDLMMAGENVCRSKESKDLTS